MMIELTMVEAIKISYRAYQRGRNGNFAGFVPTKLLIDNNVADVADVLPICCRLSC